MQATPEQTGHRVIKARHKSGQTDASYHFLDLRQRCENYAANIWEQCRNRIIKAELECEEIRNAAYQQGRREGLAEGLSDAAEQITKRSAADSEQQIQRALTALAPALAEAVEAIEHDRTRWRSKWESAAVELAISLAGMLTERMIEADPSILAERGNAVLGVAAGHVNAVLHFHPDDLKNLGEMRDQLTNGRPVELVADPRVERGGCVLTSDSGEVDGQLSTQLERIAEELLKPAA